MRKSLLIASLAVISMNVLGMNPLGNNNLIGNNPRHTLTPDSSPRNNSNLIESIQESVFKFSQGDLTENEAQKLVDTMFSLTIQLRSRIFESEQKIRNLEEQNNRNAQLISEQNSAISSLNNSITQFQSANRQLASRNENLHRNNVQLRLDKRTLDQNISNLQICNQQLQFINQNLNRSLTSARQIILNGTQQVLRKGSLHITKSTLQDFAIHRYNNSNKTDVTISELSEDNTMERAVVLQSPVRRPVPEDDSVSQPQAKRQRINSEEATISTSHLQQSVEIQDENAADLQNDAEQIEHADSTSSSHLPQVSDNQEGNAADLHNDAEQIEHNADFTTLMRQPDELQDENTANRRRDSEQIDQNLADRITLKYWVGSSLNREQCIKLFSYLTDPNYAGITPSTYLNLATSALNVWNVITDNEREYLSILARNIHRTLEEFPIQDRERINELEPAIRVDRNILPDENLKIMVNTGPKNHDLIEIINDVRDIENDMQAAKFYSGTELIKPLITVLAQTNWPAQPYVATDAELNNFEQSVQAFVDQYNQRRTELENSNNPDKDKLLKTNIVDTVLNLRKFSLGDHIIVNRLNLFDSEFDDNLSAYEELKSLYPCLQKGYRFHAARKKAIAALHRQGKSNKEIAQLLGISKDRVRGILSEIR